jgi:cell division septal protein FtsQ
MSLPVRRPVARGSVRRRRGAGLLARVFGIALALGAAGAGFYLVRSGTFNIDSIHVSGLVYTNEQTVLATVGIAAGDHPSAFALRPAEMAEQLRGLPSVESADVEVNLPDRLEITVHERQPLFVWRTPTTQLLVDQTGALLAVAPALGGLPVLDDQRDAGADLAPGDRIDTIDLAAARLLLTIKPADIGSAAASLELSVDDENGWQLTSPTPAWRAVFGFYSANVRKPDELIPRQRQCLSSLLAARHEAATTIYLAVDGDRCGTFLDQPAPSGVAGDNAGSWAT